LIIASRMPSCSYLNSRYEYDRYTGNLYHSARKCGVKIGSKAGSIDPKTGYVRLKIDGSLFQAHRIIFKMMTGLDFPNAQIDHIDGDRANNRIENLRLADHSENQANGKVYKSNKAGFRGVHWHKQHGKYAASIQCGLKRMHIGLFSNPIEAAMAYNAKAVELFGQFVKTNDIQECEK
jgi:hypothetical protein